MIKEHEEKLKYFTDQIAELNKQKVENDQYREIIDERDGKIHLLTSKIVNMEAHMNNLEGEVDKLNRQLLEERFIREDRERELELMQKLSTDRDHYSKHYESGPIETVRQELDTHNEGWVNTYKCLSNDLSMLRQEIKGLKDSTTVDDKENIQVNTMGYSRYNNDSKRHKDESRKFYGESQNLSKMSYQNRLKENRQALQISEWANSLNKSSNLPLEAEELIRKLQL